MKSVRLIFLAGLLLSATFLVAQPAPPGLPGDPGDTNPTVPISGIEILLVGGGILGIKKLYLRNRKSN